MGWNHTLKVCSHSISLSPLCLLHTFCFLPTLSIHLCCLCTLRPHCFSPFHFSHFLLFCMTRSLTHYTFILSPLVFCALKKKQRRVGCAGGCTNWKGLCVCASVLCFALLSAGSACLLACLHCCSFLWWSPSKLYDLFSQRERSKTPSDHRESSARGFNDFTTKMSAMAGGRSFRDTQKERERKRDIQALTAHIHLLTDSRSYLGRLPNMDIKRKQEKLIATLYKYSMCSTPMYIWC